MRLPHNFSKKSSWLPLHTNCNHYIANALLLQIQFSKSRKFFGLYQNEIRCLRLNEQTIYFFFLFTSNSSIIVLPNHLSLKTDSQRFSQNFFKKQPGYGHFTKSLSRIRDKLGEQCISVQKCSFARWRHIPNPLEQSFRLATPFL